MPNRNAVSSLRSLCLSYVASNIDIWSTKNNLPQIACDDNPVVCLPKSIVDDLAEETLQKRNFRPRNLNMLLHRRTQQLDLCQKSLLVTQCATKLICNTSICENLQFLCLAESNVTEQNLIQLAKSIPNIAVLNLHATETSDKVLSVLGYNCPNLRDLNLTGCSMVTDSGISALCEEEDYIPDGRKKSGQCRFIRRLAIRGTSVNDRGASTAIRNLPDLVYFDYDGILLILEDIYNQNNVKSQLKLETIYLMGSYFPLVSNSTIKAAAVLCPNVTKIKLRNLRSTVDWQLHLADFRRLTNLTLSGFLQDTIHFRSRIESLFQVVGSNLKTLRLEYVKGVDLQCIGNYCTKLTKLRLFYCYHYMSSRVVNVSSRKYFEVLEDLAVSCFSRKYVPSNHLENLLSNCKRVKTLRFNGCQTLTDDLLSKVFERNSFSELHSFAIVECKNVSMSSILQLVDSCKSLELLQCSNCIRIDNSDFEKLKMKVRNENLNLLILN